MKPLPNREETIFEAALQLPPEQRAAHLQEACGDDTPLRQRVELLLKSHEEAEGDFLEKPRALGPNKTVVVSLPPPEEEIIGTMIGRYKLLEKIGEGGFGVVYVAEQREPVKRRIALKIIKLGMDTKQVVARFEVERQALALMDHPNIAKVFDAGATEKGRPYFVMELVRGIRITEYCDQNNLSTKERLELFARVCQAIQHAHQKGIIHRDIKPSNILVTLHDGVPVPKVIDFGIAKATQGELTEKTVYTQLQQFIGTPAYMSPEQAEMSGLDIDTRSDIYALGVLLYELLTGRTPFDQKALLEAGLDGMRRMIRELEPQRPSTRVSSLQGEDRTMTAKSHGLDALKLVHLLQGDLDWIVMKCLEKDRTRRYETANGVAMDLQRHLNNEPIIARPPSAVYRFQKFARRNRLAFAAVSAVTIVLCLGVIASTWQAVRATREQRIADLERGRAKTEASRADANASAEARERQKAEAATHRANQALSGALENEGDRLAREGNSAKALAHLARALRIDPANRVAAQRIISLLNQRDFPLPMLGQPADLIFDPLNVPAFTPDLRRFCKAADTNRTSLAVFDGQSGKMIGKPIPLGDRLTGRVWSQPGGSRMEVGMTNEGIVIRLNSDGSRLAVGLNNNTTIWECETGRKVAEFEGPLDSFSPDGKFAAVSNRIVAVDSGHEFFSAAMARGEARFSPDGQMVAFTTESNSSAGAFFTTNGQPVMPGIPTRIVGTTPFVQFSPEGRRLIHSGSAGEVGVWDLVQQRQSLPTLAHGISVWTMECSTDGRLLATGTRSGRANLWNLLNGEPAREPCQSVDTVWRICLAPDASWLATRSVATDTTNFNFRWRPSKWSDIRAGRSIPLELNHPDGVWRASYSSDGLLVLTVCVDGAARIWSARDGTLVCPPIVHGGGVKVAIFNRDSTVLATGASGGDVRLWETRSGKELKILGRHETRITALAFTPDGRYLASGAADGIVKLWETASGKAVGESKFGEQTEKDGFTVMSLAFDPAGHRLVAGYYAQRADILEAPGLRRVASLTKNEGAVYNARFSPDGKWISTASGNDAAQLWDAQTGEGPKMRYQHESGVFASDFSSDGRFLATASYDRTARIWETLTGKPVTEPLPHAGMVMTTLFSPDDRTVITAGGDGSSVVWDVQTGRALSEKFQSRSGVNSAVFSPDGRHILTASKDGLATIYDWVPLADQPPIWLAELAEAVGGYRLSETGVAEYLEDAAQILDHLRNTLTNASPSDAVAIWGQWYLADRRTRMISPYAAISVQDWAERLAQRADLPGLEEALDLGSRNPLVYQKLAMLIAVSQPETASLYRRIAGDLGGTATAAITTTPQATAAEDHGPVEDVDPLSAADLLKHEGKFVRARGKIIAHVTNHSVTVDYLNFTANYLSGLSLIYKRTDVPSEINPAALDAYTNKTVVVEGKIINFRGAPEIELTSLAQIKIEDGPAASAESPASVATASVVSAVVPAAGTNVSELLDPLQTALFLKLENQVVKVKGRLVRFGSAPSARVHYLDFTENYRTGLSLVFFAADNPAEFRPELLRNYVNKTVVTEGKISVYQGRVQMEIKSLADLKVVDDAEPAPPKE